MGRLRVLSSESCPRHPGDNGEMLLEAAAFPPVGSGTDWLPAWMQPEAGAGLCCSPGPDSRVPKMKSVP